MAKKNNDIYQIKVTLRHSKPPIWRRLQVAGSTRLDDLHLVLQSAMGWDNYHLHQYIVDGTYYGGPHPDYESWGPEMLDERQVTLSDIAPGEKSKFIYEYDFGDSWEHELLVEKIMPPEEGVEYPRCIKGKRACPPEDVGGVWGYDDFLEAIKDPKHPAHQDMREWIGDDFDPEEFDLEEINEELGAIK